MYESICNRLRPGLATWLVLALPVMVSRATGQPAGNAVPQAAAPAVAQLQDAVRRAIARAEPAVVAIAVIPDRPDDAALGVLDLGRPFLDPERLASDATDPRSVDALPGRFASGVRIDNQGHILTTYHALGDPRHHTYVVWVQGRAFKAERVVPPPQVVAGDPWTDLALLKIARQGTPIELGRGDRVTRGTFVIALGNPYAVARDGRPSAAWGIIANRRRALAPRSTGASPRAPRDTLHHYGTLLQTDVRLPLGTSGGALVNLQGRLIGITTSMAPLAGYDQGAGYAIPVDETFRQTLQTLKQGRVPAFGFLGVQPEDLTERERRIIGDGVRVVRVVRGTAADRAGLQVGDVITRVNGTRLHSKHDLIREISRLPMSTVARLSINRAEPDPDRHQQIELSVQLDKKPLDTRLPPFESAGRAAWRGIHVDHATAMPPSIRRAEVSLPRGRGAVAVVGVDRDSPAWRAGLRPGFYITAVNGHPVESPAAFEQAVKDQAKTVQLTVVGSSPRPATLTVPP